MKLTSLVLGKYFPSLNSNLEKVNEYLSADNLELWAKKSGFDREISVISELIRKYEVKNYVDIGANIGYVSLAALCNNPRVINAYLFEPVPQIYSALTSRVAKVAPKGVKIHTFNVGLGEKTESKKIFIDLEGNYGWNTMRKDRITRTMYPIDIKIEKLDDYNEAIPSIELIKIDVEGYESLVIEGGKKLIAQYLPIIYMELAWANQNSLWNQQKEKLEWLLKLGYQLFDENFKEIARIEDLQGTLDIVLIHSSKRL